MPTANHITIEVAYATPKKQLIIPVQVAPDTTALQAIEASGIMAKFPEIEQQTLEIGIFGKQIKPDTLLRPLDRVEIYRPLIADPKAVRKQRAADGKIMKKGGGDAQS